MPPKTSTALTAPTTMTPADIVALLQQSGDLTESTSFRRMRLDGGVLVTLDGKGEVEEMFPPRMAKGVPQPAVTLRIVEPPAYYNAFWLGPELDEKGQPTGAVDPNRIGRPDLAKQFSKRWDDPARQAADKNPANDVYALIEEATGKRGGFKGDMVVQVVPEDGVLTGNEQPYQLTLSASACLDWRGTRNDPAGGVVQEKNFIVQLAEKAASETDEDPQKAVLDAMTALRLGGVVADAYILQASNNDNSRSWPVIAFKPVHIEVPAAAPAIAAPADPQSVGDDDLPF
jgi:hypothetical protein